MHECTYIHTSLALLNTGTRTTYGEVHEKQTSYNVSRLHCKINWDTFVSSIL